MYELYNEWHGEAASLWITQKKTSFASFKEFMVSKLEQHIAEYSSEEKHLCRAILNRLLKAETAESGCGKMDYVSVNEFGSYEVPSGEDSEYPGGFSKLINFLAEKIPKTSIKLSHPVKSIRLDSDSTNATGAACTDLTSAPILVECYNGTKYRAKHVVLTCSVNYLKRHHRSLLDARLLTREKSEAIERIKMGTVDKIFLFYDDMSFFPANTNSIHPIFLNEKVDNMEKHWYFKTYSFDKFYDNMIIVWMTGSEANYVEKLPEQEIASVLTDLLRRVLNNTQVPLPTKIMRSLAKLFSALRFVYIYQSLNKL